MIIYSKKILIFVAEIKRAIREILAHEIGLKVGRERFYDRREKASYPIQVVVYNNKSMLGYFDPHFYELGFHENLMYTSREELHDVIRHELAHYITFIEHGEVKAHGAEFKSFCCGMGWNEEVAKATTTSDVVRKVQKLMALATSSNKHEAEQAMIKSQELLLKHNLEYRGEDDEKVCLKRILKQKRENAKMRAIAKILETFFVSTVYHRASDFIYLEILGDEVNVEIAEYVAGFLEHELDHLWNQTDLKGQLAKNSFFLGLATGYCNKIQALKRTYNQNALILLDKKLIEAKAMAYSHLSKVRSRSGHCRESALLGEQMGRALNIKPAVTNNSQKLLSYV